MKRLTAIVLVLAVGGCSRDQQAELPQACSSGTASFVSALSAAPSPVRVDGVPLSQCFMKDASTGDVQVVGSALLETAQQLGRDRDFVALGYLVGALRRGAERSAGIHLELVRRVEQEARPFRRSPGFGRGQRAGRSSG